MDSSSSGAPAGGRGGTLAAGRLSTSLRLLLPPPPEGAPGRSPAGAGGGGASSSPRSGGLARAGRPGSGHGVLAGRRGATPHRRRLARGCAGGVMGCSSVVLGWCGDGGGSIQIWLGRAAGGAGCGRLPPPWPAGGGVGAAVVASASAFPSSSSSGGEEVGWAGGRGWLPAPQPKLTSRRQRFGVGRRIVVPVVRARRFGDPCTRDGGLRSNPGENLLSGSCQGRLWRRCLRRSLLKGIAMEKFKDTLCYLRRKP